MSKKEYMTEYYKRNKDKWKPSLNKRENDLRYQEKNREKINIARRKWREDNYEKDLLMQVRKRAAREGIPFNLTIEDIVIPEYCPYLKCKITRISGKGRVWTNPSLDRIDPIKGYVKGNVMIISMKANLMKAHSSLEELLLFAKSVLEMYKT